MIFLIIITLMKMSNVTKNIYLFILFFLIEVSHTSNLLKKSTKNIDIKDSDLAEANKVRAVVNATATQDGSFYRQTDWNDRAEGNIYYLDRHFVACPRALQGFKLERDGDRIRYNIKCRNFGLYSVNYNNNYKVLIF